MNLEDFNTSRMLYNPLKETFLKDITKSIEEFKKYKTRKTDKEKVFKYICLLYDQHSPITFEISDYYQKKAEVADMLGFDKGDEDYYDEPYENILMGKDVRVNELISIFLSKQGLPEFMQAAVYREMLMHESRKGLLGRQNKDTFINIEKLTARLKELDRLLLQSGNTDEVLEVRKALYAQLEKQRLQIRPEQIVKLMEETGELPKEFDQYPEEGKHVTLIGEEDMHYYNESEQESELRKADEEASQK